MIFVSRFFESEGGDPKRYFPVNRKAHGPDVQSHFWIEFTFVNIPPPGVQQPGTACLFTTIRKKRANIGIVGGVCKAIQPLPPAVSQKAALEIASDGLEIPQNCLAVSVDVGLVPNGLLRMAFSVGGLAHRWQFGFGW